MRDACCDSPKSRKALADLQLRVDGFDGVEIAQRYERAHAIAIFLNALHADADAARTFDGLQIRFGGDFGQFVAVKLNHFVERMTWRKDIADALAEKCAGGSAEKLSPPRDSP